MKVAKRLDCGDFSTAFQVLLRLVEDDTVALCMNVEWWKTGVGFSDLPKLIKLAIH